MGLEIGTILALTATAASTAVSYLAASSQAKTANANAEAQAEQARLNGIAQAKAKDMEAAQRAAEIADQNRRTIDQQRRFRSTQLAEISGQGIALAGTPLDILANTAVTQQQELNDASYNRDTTMRNLAYESESALAMGQQGANSALAQRQQGPSLGATLLSGATSLAGIYSAAPRASVKTPVKTTPQRYY